jgi:hypothetical protein
VHATWAILATAADISFLFIKHALVCLRLSLLVVVFLKNIYIILTSIKLKLEIQLHAYKKAEFF